MKTITKKGLESQLSLITKKGIATLQSEKSATTDINLQSRKMIKSPIGDKPRIKTITMWKERWFLSTNVKDIE